MRLKHQVLSAVSATALLIAASAGVLAIGGTSTSLAEPIDPAAVSALQSAVNNPNSDLSALISQMNSEVPGSGTQFAQAFQNTDTDALANALAALAGSNAALQSTLESALTTLSQNPALASVSAGGQTLNVANIVNSINTTLSNQFASGGNSNSNNNSNNNNNNNPDNNSLANNLQNVNPTAGPNPGFNQNQFGNPFTTGNPNSNPGLNQGNQGGNPGNQGNHNNPGNQNGPGRPNSRA